MGCEPRHSSAPGSHSWRWVSDFSKPQHPKGKHTFSLIDPSPPCFLVQILYFLAREEEEEEKESRRGTGEETLV